MGGIKKILFNSLKHLYRQKYNEDIYLSVCRRQHHAEKVIEAIYFCALNSYANFSQEDKCIAANLIMEIVKELDSCVFSLGNCFDQDRGSYNLMLRSGVQFLLDDLKCWPLDCNTLLRNHLIILVEGDSVETFDIALKQRKEDPPVVSLKSVFHTEQELKRPAKVPVSHTWWF